MSTPKVTFFNWDLTNPGTPALTKVKGKKPKQNDVTLNINLNQALVAANSAIISNAFIQFATFSTSATGNTAPYTITSGGKALTLEKNFERLTVTVGGQIFTSYAQWQQFITPVTFATTVAPATNVEGSFFTVTVTATNVADGTVIPFVVTGSDAVVTTSGNITINGGSGVATIATTADADNVADNATLTLQGIALGKPGSTAGFTITEPAPAPDSVLTTALDRVSATSAAVFTIYGNEATLGQNDQLNGAAAGAAVLNIGTDGSFNIANFTSTDVETFEFRPAGDDFGDFGIVDMQSATGVTDLIVDQSSLLSFLFDDLQSVNGLSATLTDSFSDFEFNFDADALAGGSDSFFVSIAEAPIDALSEAALGLVVTEGPLNNAANLETLSIESLGPITNILDRLQVGPALETLNLLGNANLEILPDIGFLGEGNSEISLIDASGLNADLNNGLSGEFFKYTSALSGVPAGFEVSVLGAAGVNRLDLREAPLDQEATDYRVITQNAADHIRTAGGDDSILSAGGNDTVEAGGGNNIVRSGLGSDSVIAFAGNDTVEAGNGDNVVDAGNGNNSVTALEGSDSIRTGFGEDVISAGDGTNTVSSGGGDDSVVTGIGNDLIFADDELNVSDGNDTVTSGAGADRIFAGAGSNVIDAGSENDFVAVGSYLQSVLGPVGNLKLGDDTASNTIQLGAGNDILAIDTDSLTIGDSINGGEGIDTIQLFNGGVLSKSETLRTSRIEAFDLVGFGDYSITLSDELVRTSDDIGSRIFSVYTAGDTAGNVTLDLSFLTPVDAGGELLSIRYSGQADTDTELVVIRDGLISSETRLAYGEAAADADETFADILQILDSADVTTNDVSNITGLEVIELASSVNGPQAFTIDWRNMTLAQFNALVGDGDDVLIIRATPLLTGAASSLTIDLTGAQSFTNRIIIEESAQLNVTVIGGSPVIETALFFTPNADRIPSGAVVPGLDPFIPDGATVTAYSLSDLQDADFVNANEFGANETIEFRFAPSSLDSLYDQLNFIDVDGVDIFRFIPAAVNQAVSFDSIASGDAGAFVGLESIVTSGGSDLLRNIERSLFVETRGGNDSVTFEFTVPGATVFSGLGSDSVTTTDSADLVDLGTGDNTAFTFAGNDTVFAESGNDFIFAGEDNDFVSAGAGDNDIDGGFGNDLLIALGGADSIVGFDGNDSIDAGDGLNTVFAGFGADSVIAGINADYIITSVNTEVENDTVRSSGGNDTIAVGLGNDLVDAGADNDLIVLGTQFNVDTDDDLEPVLTNDVGGYSAGDSINGGLGDDTVSLALAGASTTTLTNNIVNVESFNVNVQGDDATLIVGSNLVPFGSTYEFTISDNDGILDRDGFLFDATALVQTQQLIVNDSDLGSADYRLGAGNDVYNGDSSDPTGLVTVAGNGGADTINLGEAAGPVDPANTIVYNTGNDGGQGGTGTGGDLITGYNIADDRILVLNGLLTNLGGIINAGSKVTDAQLVLGGLTASDGLIDIDLSGDNVLSLTGPSRSVLDSELTNAARIASNINGVGVIGNGLAFGEAVGLGFNVNRQTNQALIVQQGQTQTALYLYTESSFNFDVAQAYTVEAGELRQLGIFNNVLFTGTTEIV